MKELYVLTGYDGFIGQTRKPWVSIDTKAFITELESSGIKVHQHEFHEVVNGQVEIRNSLVFYSFSHRLNLQHYIRDCLLQKLDFWRRRHLRKHKQFPGYPDYDLNKEDRKSVV